ncbi:pyridoxamine 5'-phosphate oxidase family protein [Aestuariivivens sp. NBU2969]|uniref:pyridoxamine 5'-phosphate oxidase family protein n=1 Tax=Aestuariivivens sp. NBU2969 TaxID=2873267 RepID=UPI001CBAD071|nr:pyridoxamine 5'-phosphate oxidase family protein [Aestuariivivens sp. NBU2969]
MKITSGDQLRALYGFPSGRSKDKVLSKLEKHSINFIENAPFLVLSSNNAKGKLDASPRGGQSGFVKVINDHQIIIPDAKGNNRLDSLMNIIETGYIGLLFFIPGLDETLRVNGKAYISTDTAFLELFTSEIHTPKTCIVVNVEAVFLHCAKAFMRSGLWDLKTQIDRNSFPTMGQMLKDQLQTDGIPETRDEMVRRYMKDL